MTTTIDGDVKIFGNLEISDTQNLNLENGKLTENVILRGQISNMTMSSSFTVLDDKTLAVIEDSVLLISVNVNCNSLSDGSVFKKISLLVALN